MSTFNFYVWVWCNGILSSDNVLFMSDKFQKEENLYPKLVVKDTDVAKSTEPKAEPSTDKQKKDQLREMR